MLVKGKWKEKMQHFNVMHHPWWQVDAYHYYKTAIVLKKLLWPTKNRNSSNVSSSFFNFFFLKQNNQTKHEEAKFCIAKYEQNAWK